jgi:dihydroorotate dehydrogenase (NAD+) catalytic subunit
MAQNDVKPDLSAELCGVRLRNPLVLASGILGLSHEIFGRLARCGIGCVTTKSTSLKPRIGWHNPTVISWGPGLINAVGLANPGVEVIAQEIRAARDVLAPYDVPIIASIFANSIYDFGTIARYISEAQPDLIEVNISCPNLDEEREAMFAASPYVAGQVTRRVKQNTDAPVLVKLSPNVTDIVEVARAVIEAGADGISAVNSFGPGLVLDIETAQPVLYHRTGGVSGPAIRPIAVRCVYDICKAFPGFPVLAMGGVSTARDVIEMIQCGAQAVAVGSAVHIQGLDVFERMRNGLKDYMNRHEYARLADFRGAALAN